MVQERKEASVVVLLERVLGALLVAVAATGMVYLLTKAPRFGPRFFRWLKDF